MPTEEQLDTGIHMVSLGFGDAHRAGQRLTISNRTVTKLSFYLAKTGSPNGNVTFAIRKVSDDSLIASKVWGNASALPTSPAWKEVTLDTPVTVNEEVRIYQEYDATALPNGVKAYATVTDVKAGENWCNWNFTDDWTDFGSGGTNYDGPYTYTYEEPVSLPTVTTDPATSVEATTATLNGTLEDDGGEACDVRFQYGETIAYGLDTDWQLGKESVVAFEQAITGLDPNKTYHFRAQARNSAGTVNGADRSFTTPLALPTVNTNLATGQGAIAATLNGTLNQDGGEACECGFEWGPDVDKDITTPPQSKTTGETFSQVIGGLAPNTTYHFRAFATNSFGTGYGADRSFTTSLIVSKGYALGREEL